MTKRERKYHQRKLTLKKLNVKRLKISGFRYDKITYKIASHTETYGTPTTAFSFPTSFSGLSNKVSMTKPKLAGIMLHRPDGSRSFVPYQPK